MMNGKTLRSLRESTGLTVDEFARLVFVATGTVHRWESMADAKPGGLAGAVYTSLECLKPKLSPADRKRLRDKLLLGGQFHALLDFLHGVTF